MERIKSIEDNKPNHCYAFFPENVSPTYDVGGFRSPHNTNITPTANMGTLTLYARKRPQYELIKRKRKPEHKNKIAPTM